MASLRYTGLSVLLRADVFAQSQSQAKQIVDSANTHLAPVEIQKNLRMPLHLKSVAGTLHVLGRIVLRPDTQRRRADRQNAGALRIRQ